MLIRRGGGNRIAEMLHDDYENYNDLEYTTALNWGGFAQDCIIYGATLLLPPSWCSQAAQGRVQPRLQTLSL